MLSSAMHLLKAETTRLAFAGPCPAMSWASPRINIQIHWALGPVFDHQHNFFFNQYFLCCNFSCGFLYHHCAPPSLSVFCVILLGSGRPLRPQIAVSCLLKGKQTHSFSLLFYMMCSRFFCPLPVSQLWMHSKRCA